MQLSYISLNIPKALYFLKYDLKYLFLLNKGNKTYLKFFCYHFICLFFTPGTPFFNYVFSAKKRKMFNLIYKQFLMRYLKFYLYLFGIFRLKLLAVGSGYFFEEVNKFTINFYLGYSHLIIIESPINTLMSVTGRKQKILILQSQDVTSLRNLGFLIKNLHVPDVYRGKGIRYLSETIILKKGKKKFV